MTEEPLAEDVKITGKVIGAAYTVLNTLRPGLDEKLYECALMIELAKQALRVEAQSQFPVFYEGRHIGTLVPDLIVEGRVIADAKVVSDFRETHLAQMLGYLDITGLRMALMLNFRKAKLGIKRVSRQ